MTTCDRTPRRNYVAASLRALAGLPTPLHLFATDPDVAWLGDVPAGVVLHVPPRRLTRVENGAALMCYDYGDAEWLVHLEDDIRPCLDAAGSVARWLEWHAHPDRRLVLFWSAHRYRARDGIARHPLDLLFGAVAVALRTPDGHDFGAWATAHAPTWRTGDRRFRGFDKMLKEWHSQRYPALPLVAAVPSLFQHVGRQSSLDHLSRKSLWQQSPTFTGEAWNPVDNGHAAISASILSRRR